MHLGGVSAPTSSRHSLIVSLALPLEVGNDIPSHLASEAVLSLAIPGSSAMSSRHDCLDPRRQDLWPEPQ